LRFRAPERMSVVDSRAENTRYHTCLADRNAYNEARTKEANKLSQLCDKSCEYREISRVAALAAANANFHEISAKRVRPASKHVAGNASQVGISHGLGDWEGVIPAGVGNGTSWSRGNPAEHRGDVARFHRASQRPKLDEPKLQLTTERNGSLPYSHCVSRDGCTAVSAGIPGNSLIELHVASHLSA